MALILAGDIGGTKTILGIFDSENINDPIHRKSYSCSKYLSLEEIITEFMESIGSSVEIGVFAVAGPIWERRAEITNLPWIIDEKKIIKENRLKAVKILNDLESLAYYIPYLRNSDFEVLYQGKPVQNGNIAVIAPGTGLGEAFLTWDGSKYNAYATEGGHTDFPPQSALQTIILDGLRRDFGGRVSLERVCSGQGIKNIYMYLINSNRAEEPTWLKEKISKEKDPVPLIVHTALYEKGKSELCDITFETFLSILGTEVGNLGLKVLATGGIYLGGGIPPKILPALKKEEFINIIHNKGRMRSVVMKMPIMVIKNDDSSLLGAAQYANDSLNRSKFVISYET